MWHIKRKVPTDKKKLIVHISKIKNIILLKFHQTIGKNNNKIAFSYGFFIFVLCNIIKYMKHFYKELICY